MSAVGQRDPEWKPSYALIWTNAAAARLLQRLEPYLMVKRNHAAALLAFQEHVRRCKRARDYAGRLLPLSEEELEIRKAFFRTMKRLNARGSSRLRVRREAVWARRNCSTRYLAGFIDAEGSLMITKSKDSANGRSQYRARISVANTNRAVLEEIRRMHGGILVWQPRSQSRWSHAYQLVWSDGMVGGVLAAVRPYLQIKREQAEVLANFIRHRHLTRRGRTMRRFFVPLPSSVIAFREALYRRNKRLNARGVPRAKRARARG